MKLVKSLLLSSAAGISAVAGAQAADLPFRKAAPVEYVRVCDFAGAGYFYIPGSDTCLKIGGYAQGNFAYVSPERVYFDAPSTTPATGVGVLPAVPGTAATLGVPGGLIVNPVNRNQTGFLGEGRIELDARTQTAYGTVRALVRMDGDVGAGYYSQNPQGSSINNPNGTATGSNAVAITKVFIQFAGFTAGRVQSFYDFYADNYGQEGVADSDQSNIAFAYTATFGGGFSATIAAEDGANRRGGVRNSADRTTFVGAGTYGALTTVAYGGEEIPDLIGVIRYDQAWGAAQLSGAYHQVRAFVQGANGIAQDTIDLTDDGFAVQGGVQIKLPMLAAGDDLWLEGGYQNGAYQYQNSTGSPNNGYQGIVAGGLFYKGYDAIALRNGAGGYSLQLSDGFHVDGAFRHFFTPTFSDTVYGSYEENDYGGARNTDWTLGGQGHVSGYRILNQFTWTPVNNLLVQVDAGYFHVDQNLAHEPNAAPTPLPAGIKTSSDGFEGRLRVERDF